MSSRNYYTILEVDRDASTDEIKGAYRRLALIHHPDKSNHPDATRMFQDIAEAYSILSNPSKRSDYDSGLGSSSNVNDASTSSSESYENFTFENFTMNDAFNVFVDFMYGGNFPNIFREENMEYHVVDVPLSVARNGGYVEIYIEREGEMVERVFHIDGIYSGKWKPFISLGEHDTAILKVIFPPDMSIAKRRRLQKMFLGLHAVSLVTSVVKDVFDNDPFLGTLLVFIMAVALFLLVSKYAKKK